jgi:hypothetical protein
VKKFKAMKFNIGDDKRLSELVQSALFSLGYGWVKGGKNHGRTNYPYLYAESNGQIMTGVSKSFFDEDENEEINIDWMRGINQETVQLGGQTYIKSELEEALKHIKPIGAKS